MSTTDTPWSVGPGDHGRPVRRGVAGASVRSCGCWRSRSAPSCSCSPSTTCSSARSRRSPTPASAAPCRSPGNLTTTNYSDINGSHRPVRIAGQLGDLHRRCRASARCSSGCWPATPWPSCTTAAAASPSPAVLLVQTIPFQLLMIPLYVLLVRDYGLGDTYLGMILPFAIGPTAVFIFRQFFLQLPRRAVRGRPHRRRR